MILRALSHPYRIIGRRELCLVSYRSIQYLLRASALSLLVASSAVANPRDSKTEAAVQAILSDYELACAELSSQQAASSGRLRVPQGAIYELPLGAEDHATSSLSAKALATRGVVRADVDFTSLWATRCSNDRQLFDHEQWRCPNQRG
jgi:hypothetical protein